MPAFLHVHLSVLVPLCLCACVSVSVRRGEQKSVAAFCLIVALIQREYSFSRYTIYTAAVHVDQSLTTICTGFSFFLKTVSYL